MTDTNGMTGGRTLVCATWKSKTFAGLLALAGALALPQLVHWLGAVSGMGSALGETLLPMHLAVILAGLFAGPLVGLAAGAIGPAVSFLLSGMPAAAVLPFMTVELAGYGLAAGLLASVRMPAFFKLLIAQVAGRALRSAAVLIAFYGFGGGLPVASIWTSIVTGLPGIVLQWALVPLIVFWVERMAARKGEHD